MTYTSKSNAINSIIAIIESVQGYEPETRFGLTGATMERAEAGEYIRRDTTIELIRGWQNAQNMGVDKQTASV